MNIFKFPFPALIIALCCLSFVALDSHAQVAPFKQSIPAMYSLNDANKQVLQVGLVATGKVIGVKDGDTIQILCRANNEPKVYNIRLAEIDAPEKHQAYGNKAKQALSDKIFGKEVTVKVASIDRYQRTVAQIYLEERWINLEMVAEGWAWQYPSNPPIFHSKGIGQAEVQAREKRLGLWADKNPMPPWEYRKPTQVKPDDREKIQPLFKMKW